MNTVGAYDDERVHYNFSFSGNDGKHISVSFRAEPDWDLDTIFNEFRNFLIASGHDIEGQIGELYHEEDEWDGEPEYSNEKVRADNLLVEQNRAYREAAVQNFQNKTQDKFSMDHLPNNGWPFGGLTTTALPGLTSADLSGIKSIDLSSINQYPTMAPLSSQQVQSWSLSSQQIQALTSTDLSKWRVDLPGTIGGAKVTF
jgi:hypothetical protein